MIEVSYASGCSRQALQLQVTCGGKRTDCDFSGVIQLEWWQGRPFGRIDEDCLHEEGDHKES